MNFKSFYRKRTTNIYLVILVALITSLLILICVNERFNNILEDKFSLFNFSVCINKPDNNKSINSIRKIKLMDLEYDNVALTEYVKAGYSNSIIIIENNKLNDDEFIINSYIKEDDVLYNFLNEYVFIDSINKNLLLKDVTYNNSIETIELSSNIYNSIVKDENYLISYRNKDILIDDKYKCNDYHLIDSSPEHDYIKFQKLVTTIKKILSIYVFLFLLVIIIINKNLIYDLNFNKNLEYRLGYTKLQSNINMFIKLGSLYIMSFFMSVILNQIIIYFVFNIIKI